eukprot:GHRR01028442.1.p1 GENE.GHRR01028442.1~~GHRR01028442.1.p1  ORF type:complete len:119 (+),score=21.64 GHRR01028442.1:22-378(+)
MPCPFTCCLTLQCCCHSLFIIQDGALNDEELNQFQFLCFGQPLTQDELASVRQMVAERMADGLNDAGVSCAKHFMSAIGHSSIKFPWAGNHTVICSRVSAYSSMLPGHNQRILIQSQA